MKRKLLIAILLLFSLYSFYYAYGQVKLRNQPVSYVNTPNIVTVSGAILPVKLIIPSLNIELPIIPVKVIQGKWENPQANVGYWIDSPLPGNKGNSIFYAHNWPNLLGNLPKIKKGDILTIKMTDGSEAKFKAELLSVITSDQKHILNQTPDSRITLYTCTGFLDSKRFVVVGIPLNQ